MYQIFFVVLSTLLLSACATSENNVNKEKYKNELREWIGQDVNELVAAWGASGDSTKGSSGNIIYEYISAEIYTTPTKDRYSFISYAGAVSGGLTRTGGQTKELWCKTYFEINESNIVIRWGWKGNNCK
jgi:predicted small secreted protein